MKKLKHSITLVLGLAALSACSSMDAMVSKPKTSTGDYYYYSQTVPVRAQGMVQTIDTSRYSDSHLLQSSYMFK